jgi:flagellar hook-associated protein 1 FlgK
MIPSSFAGLNLSLRALYSSRKALDITSQNIANVGTKGYTRRVAQFSTFGQDATGVTDPIFGLGADCVSAERMRDEYLDTKMWNQSSISDEWATKNEYYIELE